MFGKLLAFLNVILCLPLKPKHFISYSPSRMGDHLGLSLDFHMIFEQNCLDQELRLILTNFVFLSHPSQSLFPAKQKC